MAWWSPVGSSYVGQQQTEAEAEAKPKTKTQPVRAANKSISFQK